MDIRSIGNMTVQDIITLRLHNQLLARARFDRPEDTVKWLGAVQAQDYYPSMWAVGLRTRGAVKATVERAIEDGKILRTWPMRGTVHYVPAEDAKWMVNLLANRKQAPGLYKKVGLDETVLNRSAQIVSSALSGGNRFIRKELYELLEKEGIDTSNSYYGGRGMHIMNYLARQGLICFGPYRGKQPTFVLLDEWVREPRELSRSQALAELATRYFTSHGPATEKDFAWWTGLPLREVRESLQLAGTTLTHVEADGINYWLAKDHPGELPQPAGVHLLPFLDEYLVAYKDRSAPLGHLDKKSQESAMLKMAVVHNGRVAGAWRQVNSTKKTTIEVTPFVKFSIRVGAGIGASVRTYSRFLDRPVELTGL